MNLLTPYIPFDFNVLYGIGQAVLAGLSPYSVPESFYPPAMSYLFAGLALLPETASFLVWTAINATLLVRLTGTRSLGWLLFVPALFVFGAGQIDLAFLALLPLLRSNDRRWHGPVAAALLTMKPQLAVVLLPWFLVRWDLRKLSWAVLAALALHTAPLLIRPTVYSEWLGTLSDIAGRKFGGVGVWGLGELPLLALVPAAGLLALLALRTDNDALGRSLMTLANPMFAYYDAIILVDAAPWWLLAPVSWVTLAASWLNLHGLFILLPLASVAYQLLRPLAGRGRKEAWHTTS